jgi:hypothetical protein
MLEKNSSNLRRERMLVPKSLWLTRGRQGIAFLLLAVPLVGCAVGSYGRFHRDADVTRMFRTNTVPADYRYYIAGRSGMPDAIIGIAPRYRLVSRYWEPVEPNSETFASKVAFVFRPEIWDRVDPAEGAWMIGPQGNTVGIWYSMFPSTPFKVEENQQLEVLAPRDMNNR